jgi:hypothetical protein
VYGAALHRDFIKIGKIDKEVGRLSEIVVYCRLCKVKNSEGLRDLTLLFLNSDIDFVYIII